MYLDGRFAFGCNVSLIARFRLQTGMMLDAEQVRAIADGEVRQACLDRALSYLQRRLHSRAELSRKLRRHEYGAELLGDVLDELTRLGYVDDARFARTKALSSAEHRKHGKRRALLELLKSGVSANVARPALEEVYDSRDSLAVARQLAARQAPRLRRLDPLVARRRLAAMLERRGFEYDDVRAVIDLALAQSSDFSPTGVR